MKTYIVIYNENSRGKKYTKTDLELIFSSHDLNSEIFVTSDVKEVDLVIKKYKNSKDYVFCAIGGDGTLNSLINSLLMNNIKNPEVACIASGSGSDFLRTFAMPKDINQALLRIKNNQNYLEFSGIPCYSRLQMKENRKISLHIASLVIADQCNIKNQ